MVWMIIGKCLFSCYASWRLNRARKKLDFIKQNNYRQENGLPPIYTRCQKITRSIGRLFEPCTSRLKKCCCPCFVNYKDILKRRKLTFYERLWVNGTKENFIGKSILGFIAGIFLSILLWNTFHPDKILIPVPKDGLMHVLNSDDIEDLEKQREPNFVTKIIIILIGLIMTLCLTFSDACRCILILAGTQFFTNKGRVALLAYTLILALAGPAQNSATNMEILTESLACGQELLKDSILDLFSFVTEPYTAFQKAIGHIIDSLQGVFGRLRDELKAIFETVKNIASVVRTAYNKLKSIVEMCNYEFGRPYDRCMDSFKRATEDCKMKLDSLDWMCKTVDVFDFLCKFSELTDYIVCWFPSLVKEHVFDPVVEYFKSFAGQFMKFFDARLNVTYKFDMDISRDKTMKQVFQGMKKDIMSRFEWLFEYLSLVDWTLLVPVLLVIFKGCTYRWQFLISERYDNYYLSDSLIKMDIRRTAVGGESIFPMRNRELNLYVETYSMRLVKDEKKARKLAIALVILGSIQILSYLAIDYILYKLMEWIRINAGVEFETLHDPLLGLTATVEGEGFLASMYRSIIENLNPLSLVLPSLDTRECLPHANKPNYHTYFWIGFLLMICFLLAYFEPYGLRLRHIICGWVYPYRVRERERWLYTHILTTRGNFMEFARKTIRAKIGFGRKSNWKNKNGRIGKKQFNVSCQERFVAKFPIFQNCFDPTTIKCFICGTRGHYDDRENFIDCMECNTIYCTECVQDMGDKCVICKNSLDSGISSGMESEMEVYRDNSDEEEEEESEPLLESNYDNNQDNDYPDDNDDDEEDSSE